MTRPRKLYILTYRRQTAEMLAADLAAEGYDIFPGHYNEPMSQVMTRASTFVDWPGTAAFITTYGRGIGAFDLGEVDEIRLYDADEYDTKPMWVWVLHAALHAKGPVQFLHNSSKMQRRFADEKVELPK